MLKNQNILQTLDLTILESDIAELYTWKLKVVMTCRNNCKLDGDKLGVNKLQNVPIVLKKN